MSLLEGGGLIRFSMLFEYFKRFLDLEFFEKLKEEIKDDLLRFLVVNEPDLGMRGLLKMLRLLLFYCEVKKIEFLIFFNFLFFTLSTGLEYPEIEGSVIFLREPQFYIESTDLWVDKVFTAFLPSIDNFIGIYSYPSVFILGSLNYAPNKSLPDPNFVVVFLYNFINWEFPSENWVDFCLFEK